MHWHGLFIIRRGKPPRRRPPPSHPPPRVGGRPPWGFTPSYDAQTVPVRRKERKEKQEKFKKHENLTKIN